MGVRAVGWAGVVLAVVLLVWATVVEPSRLVLHTDTVTVPGWAGAPLRVVLISDLHVGAPFSDVEKVRRVADLAAAQRPDLVLLLGDFVGPETPGGKEIAPPLWTPLLGAIPAPLGVHAVLGNHDWWNDEVEIAAALEAAGVSVLENAALPLRSGADTFWLVGVGDDFTGHDRVAEAFARVPAAATTLAMSHGPAVTDSLDGRASLVVAGHTHGGQIFLPFVTQRLLNLRWLRGAYEVDGRPLYVTSGVGNSVLPIRFGVPPELVLLTVRGPGG